MISQSCSQPSSSPEGIGWSMSTGSALLPEGFCMQPASPSRLMLTRCDKALASLSFDRNTKAQLCTWPLHHGELFGGKLDKASKQAKERGHSQCEVKVSFKVPQAQTQASSASAPTYAFQASSQCSSQPGHGWGKDRSKKGKGCGHGSVSSLLPLRTHRRRPRVSLTSTRRRVLTMVGLGMDISDRNQFILGSGPPWYFLFGLCCQVCAFLFCSLTRVIQKGMRSWLRYRQWSPRGQ